MGSLSFISGSTQVHSTVDLELFPGFSVIFRLNLINLIDSRKDKRNIVYNDRFISDIIMGADAPIPLL